jgi:competence protein ComEA
VPRIGEPVSQVAGASQGQLVNINTASAELLDSLPGIGETYSQRIVESRNHDGPFESAEDLVGRELIPRSTFDKIKDLITVGP